MAGSVIEMKFNHLISIDQIRLQCTASSKKKALETISEIVNDNFPEFSAQEVFESLLSRERLGSTGIGHGVAIPHGRLSECDEVIGVFMSFTDGIDFDSIDKQPVKLVFALLVPAESTEEHLQLLAKLAEFFSKEENRATLENARSAETVYNILINL